MEEHYSDLAYDHRTQGMASMQGDAEVGSYSKEAMVGRRSTAEIIGQK